MTTSELASFKGVGEKRLQALLSAGIGDLQTLLMRFPREYVFFSEPCAVDKLVPGEKQLVFAKLLSSKTGYVNRRAVTTARFGSGEGEIEAIWFNQPYLRKQMQPGEEGFLYGYVLKNKTGRLRLVCPTRFPSDSRGILPIYAPLEGIPQKTYRQFVRQALDMSEIEEMLPDFMLKEYHLPGALQQYRDIHFPVDRPALESAMSRVTMEDLFLFQLAALQRRGSRRGGCSMRTGFTVAQPLLDTLGFSLTGAQERVLREVLSDMEADAPMARLVQGDVGCGKTAIAFLALYTAVQNGYQGALMAPTEVLAGQHYAQAKALLEPLGVKTALLTGSVRARERSDILSGLANGEIQLAIGTHALLSDGVDFCRLGLVVTDEQHRFGVRQRNRLEQKGNSPHVLVMSATPIPRSLALVLYADLSLSVVDELPPGRKPVETRLVPESKRDAMCGFLLRQMESGRQVYVICPLVEETGEVDAADAEQTWRELKERFPNRTVELLHGRMSGLRKQEILNGFAAGKVDVLVSTTVIEVGVNVPNATIMVVENAERFGLAQLHQLRGRVGRGTEQSWCFLMGERNERLSFLAGEKDGFRIAEKDLELRGPGEFLGIRQHGALDKTLLAFAGSTDLIRNVRELAQRVLDDPDDAQNSRLLRYADGYIRSKGYEFSLN